MAILKNLCKIYCWSCVKAIETHSKSCYKDTAKNYFFLQDSHDTTGMHAYNTTFNEQPFNKTSSKKISEPPHWRIELPQDQPPCSFAWWLLSQWLQITGLVFVKTKQKQNNKKKTPTPKQNTTSPSPNKRTFIQNCLMDQFCNKLL